LANVCLPIYSNHGYWGGTGGKISGYYKYDATTANCNAPTPTVLYSTYSDDKCTVQTSLVTQTRDCSLYTEPQSGQSYWMKSVVCYTSSTSKTPPTVITTRGSVTRTGFTDCNAKQATEFESYNSYNCQVNAPNPYTGLYQGSSTYQCNAEGNPVLQGFLGSHCSTATSLVSLSTKCAANMFMRDALSTVSAWSCIPNKPKTPALTGYYYQTMYSGKNCDGNALFMSGQATGVCYTGFNNATIATGSLKANCTGYQLYSDALCTIKQQFVQWDAPGTCKPQSNPRRPGMSVSYSCSKGTSIPTSNVPNTVLSYYDNDVCFDNPVQFTSWPLETVISYGSSNRTQQLSCPEGSASPVLVSSMGSGSYSQITQYLNTQCSYMNPQYTSSFTYGPNLIKVSPGPATVDTVIYTSGQYSACPRTVTSGSDVTNGLPPGPAAGVAILVIFVVACLSAGCAYYCRRSSVTDVERGSLMKGPHSSNSEVEFSSNSSFERRDIVL
jgi:hypothetical protein